MELLKTENIRDDLIEQKSRINELIKTVRRRLKCVPNGSLRINKIRNKYYYYQITSKNDTEGRYIHREDEALAIALAQKDYDKKLLITLEQQLKAIERFLNEYDSDAPQQVYEKLTEARKTLVKPEFLSDEEYVRQWMSVPYSGLPFSKEDAEYYTAKGERVRSKSEILIADSLLRHNIPYRYEYPVYNKGVIIAAPDFNCLNVRLRKEYFWEHLGMMGEEKYADRNVRKIEKYTLAEDFDETKLIITMETDRKPLDTRVIDEKIRRYLL